MSIVVVSDTSPIRALFCLELLSLCRDLYGTVTIPTPVAQELEKPTSTSPAVYVSQYPWLTVRSPRAGALSINMPKNLDPGETQAIALGVELHADLLLVDERKATQAARQLGLNMIGVLGVLLEAKRARLIVDVIPLLDRLTSELRFFVSASLRAQIAQLASEDGNL